MICGKVLHEVVSLPEVVVNSDPTGPKFLQSSSDCQSLSSRVSVLRIEALDWYGIQLADEEFIAVIVVIFEFVYFLLPLIHAGV